MFGVVVKSQNLLFIRRETRSGVLTIRGRKGIFEAGKCILVKAVVSSFIKHAAK